MVRKGHIAHITIGGVPLCRFSDLKDDAGNHITCGHHSIAAADRARKVVQRHYADVKTVKGGCPAAADDYFDQLYADEIDAAL